MKESNNIKIRPGIVLTHVCGQGVLVSAFEVRDFCPYITLLNETGEYIWNCLENNIDVKEIVKKVRNEFDIPVNTDVEELINSFLYQLKTNGYVVYEEQEDEKN